MPVRIRSCTVGHELETLAPDKWPMLANFFESAEKTLAGAGFELQTRRLVLNPLAPRHGLSRPRLFALLESVARNLESCGTRWVCLPISTGEGWRDEDLMLAAPELIRRFPFLFINFMVAHQGRIHFERLAQVAKNILNISRLSGNGYDNFRVGAGAGIPQSTPFFPFSWHQGPPAFSIALESIGIFLKIFEQFQDGTALHKILDRVSDELIATCRAVESAALELEKNSGLIYRGQDISLAPFPDGHRSVAALVEKLGPHSFGNCGTLAATAILSRLLKKAIHASGIRAVGFNGVMYSPLEDHRLAEVMRQTAAVNLDKFCLYSAVCGCGLDMIPIAGDTLPEALASLIGDVGAMSLALRKPLGIRVLPIPAGQPNEITSFNHDFLVNTRISRLNGSGLFERFPPGEGLGALLNFSPAQMADKKT